MTEQLPKGYSPRLYNQDLGPLPQKWTWYNIFAFWMSDVHSVGGYVFAASLFALGLASWQVLIALLAGICIVQLIANLVAKPSQQAAVPYPVICRLAFGDLHAYGPDGVRFYTRRKAITQRWPQRASHEASQFAFPSL